MSKIKLKESQKEIPIFDRTKTVEVHLKQTGIKHKDVADQASDISNASQSHRASPTDYAIQKVTDTAQKTVRLTGAQISHQKRQMISRIKKSRAAANREKRIRTKEDAIRHGETNGSVNNYEDSGNESRTERGSNSENNSLSGNHDMPESSGNRSREKDTPMSPGTEQEQEHSTHHEKKGKNEKNTAGKKESNRREKKNGGHEAIRTKPKKKVGIKTLGRVPKVAVRPVIGTANTIKAAANDVFKSEPNAIKTGTDTAKTAVKTAKKTTEVTIQTARRTGQAAKFTAKVTVKTVKLAAIAAAKTLAAATKALISAIAAGGGVSVVIILLIVLFGTLLSVFGGENGRKNLPSYLPVSEEVQAYQPLIQEYAKKHGVSDYVELIKAVMMQESGGRGNDPMQASECPYNTRYPNTPNAITDPVYSIDVGIQYLADSILAAKVENPFDIEKIKLCLQGYNFGNGYISWAVTNHGGYSYTNAAEFSAMMAARLGWSGYGDINYVSNVLRYYPFNKISGGTGNQAIVEVARTQLGNVGGRPYWSWYGFGGRVEWCACFVSWCANELGYIDAGIIPKFAAVISQGIPWFKERGLWQEAGYIPAPGDIIFFAWDGSQTGGDHVGIVERVEDNVIYTIEGNSGDACKQKSYPVSSIYIRGFGTPAY